MAVVRYKDFRLNYPFIVVGLLVEIFCIHNILTKGLSFFSIFFLVVVFALAFIFISYSIEVTKQEICIKYGAGLLTSTIGLHEIVSFEIAKNRYFVAWMYNPLGHSSLRTSLRDGSTVSFPTDSPKLLQQAMS